MATKRNQAIIYRDVPGFLRRLREDAGLTQRELAAKVNQTQWWVYRGETGSRRVDVAEFCQWCAGCGIEPAAAIRELGHATQTGAEGDNNV